MIITNADLYNNKYNYETLKTNIYVVSLLDILKTQTLTEEFCIKYILNKNFQFTEEEQTINISTIQQYQPHIDINLISIGTINNKLLRRVNSFEDFESYSNRH